MAGLTFSARARTITGKKVAALRRAGITPANIYGHKVDSFAIEANAHDLNLLLRRAGRTHLINLSIEGEREPRAVLVKDVQREPTSDRLLHVDFVQVSMVEKLTVTVPIVFIGAAPALATTDGALVHQLDQVSVSCLPANIPTRIDADLEMLTSLGSSIHARDLKLPEGVELVTDGDQIIASITAASQEIEEEAEVPEEVEVVTGRRQAED